ncbi:MAG: hypothetical protein EOO15_07180 [Chitinophagaceae bacterium]|nr:MAG: hypothetical protein EOO15_07180 [Chitinophagaceae bacterium]
MKTAIFFLLIAIGLLVFVGLMGGFVMTGNSITLHLYESYFVIDRSSAMVLTILFCATLFSLGGLLGNGFRSALFWILFLLSLLCWGGITAYVFLT